MKMKSFVVLCFGFILKRSVQGVVDDGVLDLLQDDNVIRKYDAWLKKVNMTPEDMFQKMMSEPTLARVGSVYASLGLSCFASVLQGWILITHKQW